MALVYISPRKKSSGGSDPFSSNVKFLLDFELGNSTDFIDSSSSPKTVASFGPSLKTTSVSKFGTKSLYLASNLDAHLEINSGQSLFLSNEFTIEAFWKPEIESSNNVHFFVRGASYLQYQQGNWYINGMSLGQRFVDVTQWHHIALVRKIGTAKLFINGVALNSTPPIGEFGNDGQIFRIGSYPGFNAIPGYLDQVRITDAARYDLNFNVETDTYFS